jgi:Uri superfamily endonuclease
MGHPPARKGSYLLLLHLEEGREISVGRLGTYRFPAGLYGYAGSGQASLNARVGRHFSAEKRAHWHIDYLLEHAIPISALLLEGPSRECLIGRVLGGAPGSSMVCRGFGSSDCSCPTHLYLIEEDSLTTILNEIRWLSES